jgi:4-hydroxybenzoate polyprenyltransferase
MGSNPTQAQGVILFFVGFALIAVGLAAAINLIAVILGVLVLGISITLFLKCKPWEQNEE